jgi:hypothetical protein
VNVHFFLLVFGVIFRFAANPSPTSVAKIS